jgi:hypothetical protein
MCFGAYQRAKPKQRLPSPPVRVAHLSPINTPLCRLVIAMLVEDRPAHGRPVDSIVVQNAPEHR